MLNELARYVTPIGLILICVLGMETTEPLGGGSCTCKLKLGVERLSENDVNNSKKLERKYKLVNQAIHFHGPCNSVESCTIKDKINVVKDRITEYYYDEQNRLIAIPNHIVLPPQPADVNREETDTQRVNRNAIENDKYYEDILHVSINKALNKNKSDVFLIGGFYSGDCLQAKLDLGKHQRYDSECKCEYNLKFTCEKPKYPELNVHEKEVMEILEVREMSDKMLLRYKIIIRYLTLKYFKIDLILLKPILKE